MARQTGLCQAGRDGDAEILVPRLVDRAHAAGAECLQNAVARAELLAGRERSDACSDRRRAGGPHARRGRAARPEGRGVGRQRARRGAWCAARGTHATLCRKVTAALGTHHARESAGTRLRIRAGHYRPIILSIQGMRGARAARWGRDSMRLDRHV